MPRMTPVVRKTKANGLMLIASDSINEDLKVAIRVDQIMKIEEETGVNKCLIITSPDNSVNLIHTKISSTLDEVVSIAFLNSG